MPLAPDLQSFLMFSQHTAWVCYAGKPIENVVYRLNIQIAKCSCFSLLLTHGKKFSTVLFYHLQKFARYYISPYGQKKEISK